MYNFSNHFSYSSVVEPTTKNFIPSETTVYIKESLSSDINFDINLFTSSYVPIDILNNKNFENELLLNFNHKFVSFIMFDEISEDYSSSIEFDLFDYFDRNAYVTWHWFSRLFLDFINKPRVLINLLKILAKLDCNKFRNAHLCILSLLVNKDIEVKDFAIRVLESWGDSESLRILENTSEITPKWLEDYKQSVIQDLKNNSTVN